MARDDYTPEELRRHVGEVFNTRPALIAALPYLNDRGRRAVARAMGLPLTADRRVHVFYYEFERSPGFPGWTWCPETNGTTYDGIGDLVACGSWAEAFEQATAWLRSGEPWPAARKFRRGVAG